MRLFRKAAVIGVGLIGGSIALAIKKKGLADEVVGVSRRKETITSALGLGAIDRGSQDIGIVRGADLVIFATPVSVILKSATAIAKIIDRGCIVTDVASTKEEVVRRLQRLFPGYVGAHPLAGSEKRGVVHADAGIFKGALCIFTPTNKTNPASMAKLKSLWAKFGTKVVCLAPDKHDKILSFSSHLPHTIAFTLINSVPPYALGFGASGLKDTTRIAASDSEVWGDILLSNRRNILKAIGAFQNNLNKIKSAVSRKDRASLNKILNSAKNKRIAIG